MRLDGAVWFQFVSFFNLRGKIMPLGHDPEIVVWILDMGSGWVRFQIPALVTVLMNYGAD